MPKLLCFLLSIGCKPRFRSRLAFPYLACPVLSFLVSDLQVVPVQTSVAILRAWLLVLLGLSASVLGYFAFAEVAARENDAVRPHLKLI